MTNRHAREGSAGGPGLALAAREGDMIMTKTWDERLGIAPHQPFNEDSPRGERLRLRFILVCLGLFAAGLVVAAVL